MNVVLPSRDKGVSYLFEKLSSLLELIEKPLIEETNPEFLHDYRVTIRKIRTLLQAFKKSIPKEQSDYIKKELSWITHLSSEVRDLDVHILLADYYKKHIPEDIKTDFIIFQETLQQKRDSDFQNLVAALQSERYRNLKKAISLLSTVIHALSDTVLTDEDILKLLQRKKTKCIIS